MNDQTLVAAFFFSGDTYNMTSPFTAFRLAREKAEARQQTSFVHKGKTYRYGHAAKGGLMVWKRAGGSRPKRQSRRRSR